MGLWNLYGRELNTRAGFGVPELSDYVPGSSYFAKELQCKP